MRLSHQTLKLMNRGIIGIILFSILSSCSDWEVSIPLNKNNPNPEKSKRVVVVEEFTGASCVNCPKGISQTSAIKAAYPENVIVIAVHSNFLGAPATKGEPDLRTPDAQAIEGFLGSWFSKPEAAINRKYDPLNQTYRYGSPESWRGIVEEELKLDPKFDLQITKTYDENSRLLKLKMTVKALEAMNQAIHLHCGITESEIVADQLDNTGKLVDFVHSHALRKMLSAIPGDKIADAVSLNQLIEKEYSFTLPQDTVLWNPAHCEVFAYLSLNEVDKYILQGAETKIK